MRRLRLLACLGVLAAGCLLAATSATGTTTWTNVLNDQFNTGGVPSHWQLYHSPYGSLPKNCTAPSHDYVSGGYLNLVEKWEPSTPAGASCPYGAGWYTGGMKLDPVAPYAAKNQRVTVRYRIVSTNSVRSHHIIPMLWPAGITYVYKKNNGESDFLESDLYSGERTFLHYVTSSGTGAQVYSPTLNVNLAQWHTVQAQILGNVVTLSIDGAVVWNYVGNSTTVPSVLRSVVLQQECSHSLGCPKGSSGSEDIQIDWITVDTAP